jgi:hypothetical protein
MCFACGLSPDGYEMPEALRVRAREQMIRRLSDLLARARRVDAGARDAWLLGGGPPRRVELAALLARGPADVTARALSAKAFGAILSADAIAFVTPCALVLDGREVRT